MNRDFENLENDLRGALRRESPPPDFAAKILAKAASVEPKLTVVPAVVAMSAVPKRPWVRRPFTLALAAGLAAAAIIPSVVLEYRERERERSLKAKQDILVALAITRDQFRQARVRVQRVSRNTQ